MQPWVPGGPPPGQSSGGIGFSMPSHRSGLSTGYPPIPQGMHTYTGSLIMATLERENVESFAILGSNLQDIHQCLVKILSADA